MKKNMLLIAAMLLTFACAVPAVAYARDGEDDSDRTGDNRVKSQDDEDENEVENENEVETERDRPARAAKVEDREARVAEIKKKVAERKLALKQDICEKKQERLQTAGTRMYQGATSVKASLDKVYERVVGFYEKGQLTVENYQDYVDAIDAAKANAEAAMEVLQNSDTSEIDCAEATTTANRLETDRLAGNETRTQLKEYRTALVDLISSLKSAAASADNGEEATNETE